MSLNQSSDGAVGEASIAILDPIEARILGSLIEKEATTPDAYPLTANAVVLACNQKNNREPVMDLEIGAVGHALREMTDKGLVRVVDGARAQRYDHRFATYWSVTTRQQALLSVLLLRGPQTLAELHARTERLAPPADIEQSRLALERLMQREPALAVNLGRAAGQREDRYMHLLCGPVSTTEIVAETPPLSRRASVEARLDVLEAEVAALRRNLEELRGQ